MALVLSVLVGVGGMAGEAFALPLVDDVVEAVDDAIDVDDGGEDDGLLESGVDAVDDALGDEEDGLLESVVDQVVEDVVDPVVEEVVDPVVEEVVDPIVEEIVEDVDETIEDVDDVVEDVDDPVESDSDNDTTPPVAPGTNGPSAPAEPTSTPATPQDLQAAPGPPAEVVTTLEASEQPAGSVQADSTGSQETIDGLSDDRLAALLLARSQPATLGSALQPLDGVLAWLTDAPTIARLLSAPLALIDLLIRALLSAGSGLVAPLSLTAAIVVRQLYQGRQRVLVG